MSGPASRAVRRVAHRVSGSLLEALGAGEGRTLLAAVSGGVDSSALLLLLADRQTVTGWRVGAAHVDHGIADEQVREMFQERAAAAAALAGAPLSMAAVDAPAEAASGGGGIEAAARRARYRALARLAEEAGASAVATGHTRDDQAETILLHIVRGSGLEGLAGMPSLGPLPEAEGVGLPLARPLLGVSRVETEAVCAAWGFEPARDPSNADLGRARNRLRHEALPALRAVNPQIDAALSRLAESARVDLAWLTAAAAEAEARLRREEGGATVYGRAALRDLAPALRVRVLRLAAARRGPPLTGERSAAALALLERGFGRLELGSGRVLELKEGRLRLCSTRSGRGC